MSASKTSCHILLCGGTLDFRRQLHCALSHVPGVDDIVEVATHREAIRSVLRRKPDILFLKDSPKRKIAADSLRDLSGTPVKAIVCMGKLDDRRVLELLRRGARGVIDRWDDPAMLSRLVRRVSAGEVWVSRKALSMLLDSARQELRQKSGSFTGEIEIESKADDTAGTWRRTGGPATLPHRFGLTARQTAIVQFVVEGLTNREIAARFAISENTVKHHLRVIFDKMGVHNRLELATFAAHHRLAEASSVTDSEPNQPSWTVK